MPQAGNLVNTSTNYVNAYTGAATNFSGNNTFSPTMKTFYDTVLLVNIREKQVFVQLGKKLRLPANHGKTYEVRKWNTIPDADKLVEGVIPEGKKFGQTSLTAEIVQHGLYVATSDVLQAHAIDKVITGAMEEIGASLTRTLDKLCRNALMAGNTNVLYADAVNKTAGYAYVSTPTSRNDITNTPAKFCGLSPDMIAKAVTTLEKANAPYFEGGMYVAVAHPSVIYDLRRHPEWIDVHKYSATEEIFNGEMGTLNGVRFIKTTTAPIVKNSTGVPVYLTMFFGREAFAVIEPEGMGIETIIHGKETAGGPLEQFSTIGGKFETATKILYPERMIVVESASGFSGNDDTN